MAHLSLKMWDDGYKSIVNIDVRQLHNFISIEVHSDSNF